MADENTEEEATEVVTLTASRECGHFRAEVTIQFGESADPRHEIKFTENLVNALRGAAGYIPNPDIHEHVFSQVLEAPTRESIDAAVEQFRQQLQEHLEEHRHERDDDSTGLPQD